MYIAVGNYNFETYVNIYRIGILPKFVSADQSRPMCRRHCLFVLDIWPNVEFRGVSVTYPRQVGKYHVVTFRSMTLPAVLFSYRIYARNDKKRTNMVYRILRVTKRVS